MKRLIYLAVDNRILKYNPLEDINIKRGYPQSSYISKNQLQEIISNPKPNPLQELAIRTFIFSCFRGLAYVDVSNLYPHYIGTTAEGRKYIRTYRKKTHLLSYLCHYIH